MPADCSALVCHCLVATWAGGHLRFALRCLLCVVDDVCVCGCICDLTSRQSAIILLACARKFKSAILVLKWPTQVLVSASIGVGLTSPICGSALPESTYGSGWLCSSLS
jgi:hypothetical protein